MVLATSNQAKQLLYVSYIGKVQSDDFERNRDGIRAIMTGLRPGFRLLVDLSHLEMMEVDCAPELGGLMELIDRSGVAKVVRVIPDQTKDIGMNILTAFHYRNRPQTITCKTMTEAARELSL